MKQFFPVAEPALIGNEKAYVMDCLDSTWISSNGKYIGRFEAAFAALCQVDHALACNNGTAALHLALRGLDVGPGDEVIVPTLTYIATANAVTYCGARPVFVDSEASTWNIDPDLIEEKITPQTRGIIVVHLYGLPADMDPIMKLARKHGLFVIEDAAQAHGAEYRGQRIGSIGDIATFSFYGNKVITTGEGGMVVTDDDELAARVRQFKGQGMDLSDRYWFPMVGYNYRMTNVAAAIGLAQIEKFEWHLSRRREVASQYYQRLGHVPGVVFQVTPPWSRSVHWLTSITLGAEISLPRDDVMRALADVGVDTRPFFYPMHTLPMYLSSAGEDPYPIAEHLSSRGFSLPSSAMLSVEDVETISDQLVRILTNGTDA